MKGSEYYTKHGGTKIQRVVIGSEIAEAKEAAWRERTKRQRSAAQNGDDVEQDNEEKQQIEA